MTCHPARPLCMRRSVHAPLGNPESAWLIWQRDPGYLAALGKIHDGESVEVGKLYENTARGAVRICLESHRPHGLIEIQFPCDLIGPKINDCGRLAFEGTTDCILAVRRGIDVMDVINVNAF